MSNSEDEEVNSLIHPNIAPGSRFGVDKKLINVIILGLSCMCVFTAFQTCAMIEVCICILFLLLLVLLTIIDL